MLSFSSNLKDNLIPLPEASEDFAMLLKVLTGTAGDVDDFQADIHNALKLFKFIDKYDISGGNQKWIAALLETFIAENPLEWFAAACEHTPTDLRIARLSILVFPSQVAPNGGYDSYTGKYRCNHLSLTDKTNPARWQTEYIQRLGLANYIAYVHAWNVAYLQRATDQAASAGILQTLADTFCSKLKE